VNPTAAQEFMDLLMLDDYVARKRAGDDWTRKWIATVMLEHPAPRSQILAMERTYGVPHTMNIVKAALINRMLEGIAFGSGNVKALRWEVDNNADQGRTQVTRVEMHVVLQEPRELDAGKDATEKMLEMAKGSK